MALAQLEPHPRWLRVSSTATNVCISDKPQNPKSETKTPQKPIGRPIPALRWATLGICISVYKGYLSPLGPRAHVLIYYHFLDILFAATMGGHDIPPNAARAPIHRRPDDILRFDVLIRIIIKSSQTLTGYTCNYLVSRGRARVQYSTVHTYIHTYIQPSHPLSAKECHCFLLASATSTSDISKVSCAPFSAFLIAHSWLALASLNLWRWYHSPSFSLSFSLRPSLSLPFSPLLCSL